MTTKTRQNFTFFRIQGPKGSYELLRNVAVSDTGEIYIPAAMGDDETLVILSAIYDRVPAITYTGHIFLPIKWMRDACPGNSDIFDMIEKRVAENSRDSNRHQPTVGSVTDQALDPGKPSKPG